MFAELQFEDIIFGIFPIIGGEMRYAYDSWTKNSVGDIIEMLMQMLEVSFTFHILPLSLKVKSKGPYIYSWLEYCPSCEYYISWSLSQNFQIHLRCFQDAFRDNFVVQWHPESLGTMKISFTRPRVYLIDFENAIQFPAGCPDNERVSMGLPLGGSATDPEKYGRPHAPEFASGIAYSPFKLDIWQLGISFSDFKVGHSFRNFFLLSCLMPRSLFRAPFPQSTISWRVWLILTLDIVWTQRRPSTD